MEKLAEQISDALGTLIGQPLSNCWRAADMQIFGFGPTHPIVNRRGETVEFSDIRLHVQCRWRLVDSERILFGRDDLLRPGDESVDQEAFDWDKQASALDVLQRAWMAKHQASPPKVVAVNGDGYGGFRIELESSFVLEGFPCDSERGEFSEHWRLFGHRSDDKHFVVTGEGVESSNSDKPN